MKLVSVEEMRRIEQQADAAGQSYEAMMEQAGRWVALMAQSYYYPEPIDHALVLVGPGNNGGDGLVAAHYLREGEVDVTVYIWKRDPKGDKNLTRLKRRRRGVTILWADNDADFEKLREELQSSDLIIDALLGTGAARPIGGRLAELLAVVKEEVVAADALAASEELPAVMPRSPLAEAHGISALPHLAKDDLDDTADFMLSQIDSDSDQPALPPSPDSDFPGLLANLEQDDWDEAEESALWPRLPVVAVDCPSGLNCDTGALDPAALQATMTVTFAYPKWGQLEYPGAGACGHLTVVDIGVPPGLGGELPVEIAERNDVQAWLPKRPGDANKGTFGKAMIAAGSLLYTGAPALSARAAAHSGAGLVTLAVPRDLQPILAGALLEITWLPLASSDGVHCADGAARLIERLKGYDALLVGPGMTTEQSAGDFLDRLLGHLREEGNAWQGKAVIDADALNLLSTRSNWPTLLPPLSILTPHPGEMSRLTGLSIEEINGARIATARRFSQQWGHVVLLKGAHTVVAHPDGRASVLPWAEPALAKAGSGDVLSGAIVAMLAQGLDPFRAAVVGGFVHGLAGVRAGATEGAAGVTANELLAYLPRALHELSAKK